MHSCGMPIILLKLSIMAAIQFIVYNRYSFHIIQTAKNNTVQDKNIKKTKRQNKKLCWLKT